ncbi:MULTISPECIES: acyltransferase family protein [Streptomyces]|uniref:acyltransferase family protein n=1 Tax=Streptomyces TaxID=1883 RepID=UPI001C302682|nr:acyltransferase [Streptomyces sp. GbtcB7]
MSTDRIRVVTTAPQEAQASTPPDGPSRHRPSRLPSLTGLRFPAAFMVFVFHASLPLPLVRLIADDKVEQRFGWAVGPSGAFGVTFFFVLSGFVLTWSAPGNDTAPSFWRRRFVKILPNYVVAWILAMVLYAAATPVLPALGALFMFQVWTPYFSEHLPVNPPSWSLAVEAVFYLVFPLLLAGIRSIPTDRLKYWITGTVAAVFVTPLVTYYLVPAGPHVMPGTDGTSPVHYWFAYIMPLPRVLDFALGILVARAVMLNRWRNIGMVWSGVLLAAGYVACYHVPYLYAQRAMCLIPAVTLIAAAAMADQKGGFTLFRSRAMVWLGNVSFAFYLLHFIVLAWFRKMLGVELYGTGTSLAILAGEAVVTLLASWALYSLVEGPLTRRFSRARHGG